MNKQSRKLLRQDVALIAQIADRAVAVAKAASHETTDVPSFMRVFMCVGMAHQRSPLDLDRLLHGPLTDFTHDVFGIMRHIDLETGYMRDCFVPRYAQHQHRAAS